MEKSSAAADAPTLASSSPTDNSRSAIPNAATSAPTAKRQAKSKAGKAFQDTATKHAEDQVENTKKRALTPLAQPMLLQRATQDLLPPVTRLARMETSLRQAPKRQQRRRHPPKRQQHRRHPPKQQQRRRPMRKHRRHPPKRQQHRSHPGKKALRANRPAQGSSERQL